MKKFFQEFKEFIAKGNVLDMAVAVVVGGAFKEIVNALVSDVVMPLISLATGGVSVEDWKWVITPASVAADGTEIAESALMYGHFIQTIIDFFIIAFCIFVALKVVLTLQAKTKELMHKKAEEEAAAATEADPEVPAESETDVLKDIRELLRVSAAEKK